MKIIDLRSDTVTRPNDSMRQAMANAPVGDDVYGDDPTVNELQTIAAEISGKESALFVPSGTQSNLIALLTHCQRGEEYIVGQTAHTYRYEGGGAAVLGSIQPQPIVMEKDGTLDLNLVESVIKPDDIHFAKTRLLCLENTQGGKVLPMEYIERAGIFAKQKGLNFHLDGARVCNAAVALELSVKEVCQAFDSVSICLSKGLGAPVGSVLCGSSAFIHQGKRWRKMLGGGMRQAGILAAAGIIALTENIHDLDKDHKKAQFLAQGLKEIEGIEVIDGQAHTNMVFVRCVAAWSYQLHELLKVDNILMNAPSASVIRIVLHRDIEQDRVELLLQKIMDIAVAQ